MTTSIPPSGNIPPEPPSGSGPGALQPPQPPGNGGDGGGEEEQKKKIAAEAEAALGGSLQGKEIAEIEKITQSLEADVQTKVRDALRDPVVVSILGITAAFAQQILDVFRRRKPTEEGVGGHLDEEA